MIAYAKALASRRLIPKNTVNSKNGADAIIKALIIKEILARMRIFKSLVNILRNKGIRAHKQINSQYPFCASALPICPAFVFNHDASDASSTKIAAANGKKIRHAVDIMLSIAVKTAVNNFDIVFIKISVIHLSTKAKTDL